MSQQSLSIESDAALESVESYQFEWEPIRGYPELRWAGKRPFRSTRYYPAQLKETYGEPVEGWTNKIYWGDNLQVMSHLLKEYRGKVQLVYIDPPFDSNADYKKQIRLRGASVASDHSAFEEKQYSDIWSNDEYLQYLYERLILVRELLTSSGSVYVHCDVRRSHQIRMLLDEVFGPSNFVSEIIWQSSDAQSSANRYGPIHNSIFYYSKTEARVWNDVRMPLSKETADNWYVHEEVVERQLVNARGETLNKGFIRRYNKGDLTARKPGGDTLYEWKGVRPPDGRYWAYSKEKMRQFDAEERIVYSSSGRPYLKRYLDEVKGTPPQDLWTDISMIRGISGIATGYPTEKPEKLLDRVISISSNPGDIVFDCFMGSGTTQAVAMKLGRRFIGADINLGAIDTTKKRLVGVAKEIAEKPPEIEFEFEDEEGETQKKSVETFYTGFEYYVVNHYDVFRNPDEAREILLKALEVQPLPKTDLFHGQKDGRLVYVMPPNRIATRQDLNDIITRLDYALFEKRAAELSPGKPVEQITLVCMGHEPGLGSYLRAEVRSNGFEIDVEVVDVLRDRQDLQFKRESDADVAVEEGELVIHSFYPMNLLAKLSLERERVSEWRELVDSVMIDFNYDGAVMAPTVVDIPEKNGQVKGRYPVPDDAGTVRVKITDLLSESWEGNVQDS